MNHAQAHKAHIQSLAHIDFSITRTHRHVRARPFRVYGFSFTVGLRDFLGFKAFILGLKAFLLGFQVFSGGSIFLGFKAFLLGFTAFILGFKGVFFGV